MSTIGTQLSRAHIEKLVPDMVVSKNYVSDFNTCLTAGFYSCIDPDAIGLPPGVNAYGFLAVETSIRYGLQTYYSRAGEVRCRLFIVFDPNNPYFTDWVSLA